MRGSTTSPRTERDAFAADPPPRRRAEQWTPENSAVLQAEAVTFPSEGEAPPTHRAWHFRRTARQDESPLTGHQMGRRSTSKNEGTRAATTVDHTGGHQWSR
ncbi:unnamed protein product [Urochloa humidicola]